MREALSELERKRLIKRSQGRRSVVTDFYRDATDVRLELSELSVSSDNAIEIEDLVEPQLVRLGARNATRADILQLEGVLDASHEDMSVKHSMQMDIEFHLILARMCGNPLILGVSQLIAERTEGIRSRAHSTPEIRRTCIAGHREIHAAVAARDPDRAEQAMRRHLADAHRFMRG